MAWEEKKVLVCFISKNKPKEALQKVIKKDENQKFL